MKQTASQSLFSRHHLSLLFQHHQHDSLLRTVMSIKTVWPWFNALEEYHGDEGSSSQCLFSSFRQVQSHLCHQPCLLHAHEPNRVTHTSQGKPWMGTYPWGQCGKLLCLFSMLHSMHKHHHHQYCCLHSIETLSKKRVQIRGDEQDGPERTKSERVWLTFSALAKFVAPKSSMKHPVRFCKSWCFNQASDQSNTREKEIDNPQVRVHEDMCLLQVHLPTLQFLNILCLILCGPKSVDCRHENIWNDKKRETQTREIKFLECFVMLEHVKHGRHSFSFDVVLW